MQLLNCAVAIDLRIYSFAFATVFSKNSFTNSFLCGIIFIVSECGSVFVSHDGEGGTEHEKKLALFCIDGHDDRLDCGRVHVRVGRRV